MILPERVFGRSGTNTMRSGRANLPIFASTMPLSFLASSTSFTVFAAADFRMTKAMRPWPLRSCFTPMTADSATAASSMKIASSSAVPMR